MKLYNHILTIREVSKIKITRTLTSIASTGILAAIGVFFFRHQLKLDLWKQLDAEIITYAAIIIATIAMLVVACIELTKLADNIRKRITNSKDNYGNYDVLTMGKADLVKPITVACGVAGTIMIAAYLAISLGLKEANILTITTPTINIILGTGIAIAALIALALTITNSYLPSLIPAPGKCTVISPGDNSINGKPNQAEKRKLQEMAEKNLKP